jgi:predicted MFS family arabinose efflux permease
VLVVVGVLGFAWTMWAAGLGEPPKRAATTVHGLRELMQAPGVLPLMVAYCLMCLAFTGLEFSVIAWTTDRGTPGLSGVMLALWATGSALGGVVVGSLVDTRPRLVPRAILVTLGVAVLAPAMPPVSAGVPWLVGPLLVVAGLAIAPCLAGLYLAMGELAPERRRAESFGWLTTAATLGFTAGSILTGAILDVSGPAAALAVSVLVLTVVAAAVMPRVPPLPAGTPSRG